MRQTIGQTNKQTEYQTERQMDKLSHRQLEAVRQLDKQTNGQSMSYKHTIAEVKTETECHRDRI